MGLNIKDLRVAGIDFTNEARLADRHSMELGNVPPTLSIAGVPAGTVELALICHDPDAPLPLGYTHWVLYGIAPTTTVIDETSDASFRPAPNSNGNARYDGPAPPPGHGLHHYYFWVYALDKAVEGTPSREQFLIDYAPHILEQNRVVGTYQR